jgi:hypothetical protein
LLPAIRNFRIHRTSQVRATSLVILSTALLVAVPTLVGATTHAVLIHERQFVAPRNSNPTTICNKVSAASISSIVGYKVPPGVGSTLTIPASKSFNDSAIFTACYYGNNYGITPSARDVTLSSIVLSKPVSLQKFVVQFGLTDVNKCTPYSGLGVPGIYCIDFYPSGLEQREVAGDLGGRLYFVAFVFTKVIPVEKIGALAKLAQELLR